jgi:sulfonate transport system permease protein
VTRDAIPGRATTSDNITRGALAWRPLLVPLTGLAVWEAMSHAGCVSNRILPPPEAVVHRLWDGFATGGLSVDLAASLTRAGFGFVLGATSGIALGLLLGLSLWAGRCLGPLFLGYRQVALFAWVPLLSMWFGGGETGKTAFIALAAMAPAAVNTWRGTRALSRDYVELGAVLMFRPRDYIGLIALPGALPAILTGLRAALIAAWLATVGAELFLDVAPGLGGRMNEGRETFQMDLVLGSILLLGLVGLTFGRLAVFAETFLLRKRTAG